MLSGAARTLLTIDLAHALPGGDSHLTRDCARVQQIGALSGSGVVRPGAAASCESSAEAAGAGVEAAGLGAEAGSGVEDCGGVGGGEDGVEG